jgi:cytochrome c oxidase assembly protein subunit 11
MAGQSLNAVSPAPTLASTLPAANRRLALRLVWIVVFAVAFAYAQVPLYRAFCEWTGIYDIARADTLSSAAVGIRQVGLEFDANSHDGHLRFRPKSPPQMARTGELVHITYIVENLSDRTVIGQAIPSYGPKHAAAYVKKLDCFCFKQQTFAPHEVRELPVVFAIDPEAPDDITTVTLSYTFFEVPAGDAQPNDKAGARGV